MKNHIEAVHDLNEHIESVLEGKKPFECNCCDSDVIIQADLDNQERSVHEGKKSLKCSVCDAYFNVENDLKSHI